MARLQTTPIPHPPSLVLQTVHVSWDGLKQMNGNVPPSCNKDPPGNEQGTRRQPPRTWDMKKVASLPRPLDISSSSASEADARPAALQSSLQPQRAVAALPDPPPSPAWAGTVLSSRRRNLRLTPVLPPPPNNNEGRGEVKLELM